MIKRLIFCLLIYNVTHAMQPAEPITGAEMVMAKLCDAHNSEYNIMCFLESFEDFDAQVDVNKLLPKPDDPLPLATWSVTSLLHEAVKHQFGKVVEFLLNHNANANLRDGCGLTPLGRVLDIRVGEIDFMVQTLLAHGASQQDIDIDYNSDGEIKFRRNALEAACFYGHLGAATLFLRSEANPRESMPLILAAKSKSYNGCALVQLLLTAGADPAMQDTAGDTALTAAALCDSSGEIMQSLLQTRDKTRRQVLAELIEQELNSSTTSQKQHSRRFLLSIKTNYGESPLIIALKFHRIKNAIEIVKCLTYSEIEKVISFTEVSGNYNVLLHALAAPANYDSILQEARDNNNQRLVRDLRSQPDILLQPYRYV